MSCPICISLYIPILTVATANKKSIVILFLLFTEINQYLVKSCFKQLFLNSIKK